jgi:hypothetical protein
MRIVLNLSATQCKDNLEATAHRAFAGKPSIPRSTGFREPLGAVWSGAGAGRARTGALRLGQGPIMRAESDGIGREGAVELGRCSLGSNGGQRRGAPGR